MMPMMPKFYPAALLLCCAFAFAFAFGADAPPANPAEPAPQIFLDKNPKIVAYQLKRLTNPQLLGVERKADDPKYKPVWEAILARKGVEKKYRQEAVEALAKLNNSDAAVVILNAIGTVEADDPNTLAEVVGLLMAQTPEALVGQREKIEALTSQDTSSPAVKQAAFAALAVADESPEKAWQLASAAGPESLRMLLGGLSSIPDPTLRGAFYPQVKPLVAQAPDEATQAAAIDAISYLPGHEDEVFKLLADAVQNAQGGRRDAAVRSLRRIPTDKWPKDGVEPLAQAVVKLVEQTPADQRTTTAAAEAVQLGEELAAALPAEKGTPVRKALRELVPRTVVFHTIKEQMLYDLRYFAVEGGKPVQVILQNTDTMPHNWVLVVPGALQRVGVAGGAMQPPSDPDELAFVPDTDDVLEATPLVQPGEAISLSFDAPAEPGEYTYLCTYPGHWVRMYGVMVVVPDLEAWDRSPTAPNDPIDNKPFKSQKIAAGDVAPAAPDHGHKH